MEVGLNALRTAIGPSPPDLFDGQITLGVTRRPASPYVFPLSLTDGTPGIGLVNEQFQSWIFSRITVE